MFLYLSIYYTLLGRMCAELHFWTNFTTHLTLLVTTFIRVCPKKDHLPLLRIQTNFRNPPLLLDPVIRHPRRPLQLDTEDKYFTLETESKKEQFYRSYSNITPISNRNSIPRFKNLETNSQQEKLFPERTRNENRLKIYKNVGFV